MKRLLLLAPLLFATQALSQVSYTGGVYSQNFDSLPGTTNNTLNSTWTDNSTLPGWYASKTTFSVTDGTVGGTAATFDSTSTTANNVGLFSFGTAASTDRALGVRATSNFAGNDPVLHGVRLVNNTSQTLTKFTITYTGEQWFKSSVATAHTLLLDYQLGASSISAGTWTAASAGTFTAPIATGTTATALNGNTTANRTVKVAVVTGVSWAPGQELWVRFRDANESGNEQGLAVDDFSFLADNESALFYNGSTSYVTMGFGTASATAFGASDFTLECRFLRTGAGATASTGNGGVTAVPLIAKGVGEAENSNIDANYFLGIDASGRLTADFEQFSATNNGTAYAAGQNFPITGTTTLQNGVWYHVAATYNTSTATWKLYVNGVEETTTTVLATFAGVVPRSDSIQGLGIGTTLNSTGARAGFFQGIIDEARIWNVTRTQSQIANNKDAKIISGQSGMLARFGFDEATGTTAAGTKADGSATTSGTLSGTTLPQWVNAKAFVANAVPTVSITAPVNGASVMAPATVSITANAADSDGTIAKVEFFNGAAKIGEDLTSPYQFDWSRTNADTGTFSLTAIATDNGGSTTTSTAVSLTITPNSNQPPVITLSSPANNATGIGSSTTISTSITDPEGDAQTVTFYGRMTAPSTPGADFTIATLPDTQFYSENLNNNNRAATYHAQTQWLVDNRDSLNLAFVSHMGDIVQNGDAVPAEWLVADAAMQRIENQTGTLRAHGIPWGAAPGNHDQTSIGNAGGANAFYNQYFGTSRFIGRRYWGGSQSVANNNNNYQLFSASGLDFIILHLEYDTRSVTNYQAVMDWADAVMKAYPNRRAIVTSHWIVDTGNPAPFSTQGQNLYNDLKDNPNFFMMLCGHVAGEGQRSDTFQGRTVYSILQDYQGRTNGGDGWLRYFIFSPANNTISARTYRVSNPVNPAAGSFETDADSQFTLNYNMQNSQTDWIPLGTVNVAASGTTASLNWTGLTAGKDYEWYATANDGTSVATSSTRRFTTAANTAPTVAITAPVNNASYTAPGAFTLTADAGGSIARVEFYQGGTKLGEDTTAPYEQSVSGLLVGSYSFTAVAVDTNGQATLSAVVNVTVNASLPPVVALTAPTAGATYDALASINLTADATDPDGSVTLVEFFNGATKLGEDSSAPYTFNWTDVITGSYSLTAKATDNATSAATSAAVAISVTNVDNVAPTVAITAPTNGSSAAPGVSLGLTATASDTDGIISKVEFFDGATLLGEDTSAPFTFTVAALATGAHTFTAKATDNDAGTTTSSVVNVTGDPAMWAYSQNFDSMGTSGTTPPSGWSMRIGTTSSSGNAVWTDSNGILAAGVATLAANANALTATTTPSANNNNGYNAAASAGNTSNRVLATAPTTFEGIAAQLSLTNGSGAALSAIRIGYDIIRYTAVGTANELPGYWLFYSLDNGTTWTNASVLNPTLANVPNTAGTTTVPTTTVALSGTWAANTTILFRWVDDNAVATSPDQIIGLDNVSITVPQAAPTVALTAPANNATLALPGPINLTATAADANGTVTKVEFFAGATKLGEDTDNTDSTYQFAWSGAISGPYVLTAKATDNNAATTTSAAVNITVTNPSNLAPAVAISSPANNALVPASSLTISATASDTDGLVSKVEFFKGATKLGEDTSAPFAFTWVGVPVGSHSLTAVATDNDGGVTTSAAIAVTATAFTDVTTIARGATWKYFDQGADQGTTWKDSAFDDSAWASGAAELGYADSPVTVLRQGPDGQTSVTKFITYYFRKTFTVADASQVIGLQANLLRDDGAVIYLNGVEVARSNMVAGAVTYLTPSETIVSNADETTYFPLFLPASALVTGTNVIAVSIHQRDNTSSDLSFDMDLITTLAGGNELPVVGIISPANNATFFPGASIPITATATDGDGTITKVEFFNGATKLGEDLTSPYEFTINNATAGTYTLTARATDDFGSTATSAVITATVTLGPSGTLARGPYLNMNTHNSIVVRWRSSQSVVGRVRYGTTSTNLDQFTDEATTQTNHEVKLTGLTPYTRYYYSVGSASDSLTPEAADTTSVKVGNTGSPSYTFPTPTAADYTFRTSPTPGTATNTRIWVVGDCGRGSATQAGGRNAYYNWMGSRLPDLNLQLGDNAYNSGTDTEYQSGYYLMYPTIFRKMPQWSCLGNHDANNGTTTATTNFPYFDMFTFPTAGECGGVSSGTEHYYSFDYGNIHFICLDSQTTLANNSPTAPQTVWLQNDLASTTATWIIAFFHHPPYSKGSHNSDSEAQMMTMRQVYNPILEAGGVDLVLTGHSHNYERSVLLDGHYGLSSTITSAMKKNAGNGSTTGFTTAFTIAGDSGKIRNAANGYTATATVNGAVIPADGAYIKPLLGSRANFGAVYNTAGMSGQADGGAIDHTAMYISYDTVGTVNLDIDGNTLTATFVQADGNTPDNYTIIKQGGSTAPVATTSPATNVGATTATLNASINPTGTHSTAKFQVGTTTSYGTDLPVTLTPDDDVVSQAVSLNLTDLTPGTTYYYRASATNTNGTTNGAEATFTTLQNNANLAGLGISTGTLSPPFTPATTSYSLNVANATTSVAVTPVSATATLQVRVNGGAYASVTSGTASADLALNVNANPIEIKVTAQDGTVKTYTVTVTRATLFTEWAPLQGLPPAAAAPTADADGDGVSNLVEYAFGLNPTSTDSTPLTVTAGGAITARGTPVTTVASTPTAVDFRAAHVRRKDAAAAGLTYTVQFSAGDGSWTSSTDTPSVVASDSEVEVVTVKYPLFLNGKKARFFRVVVSAP